VIDASEVPGIARNDDNVPTGRLELRHNPTNTLVLGSTSLGRCDDTGPNVNIVGPRGNLSSLPTEVRVRANDDAGIDEESIEVVVRGEEETWLNGSDFTVSGTTDTSAAFENTSLSLPESAPLNLTVVATVADEFMNYGRATATAVVESAQRPAAWYVRLTRSDVESRDTMTFVLRNNGSSGTNVSSVQLVTLDGETVVGPGNSGGGNSGGGNSGGGGPPGNGNGGGPPGNGNGGGPPGNGNGGGPPGSGPVYATGLETNRSAGDGSDIAVGDTATLPGDGAPVPAGAATEFTLGPFVTDRTQGDEQRYVDILGADITLEVTYEDGSTDTIRRTLTTTDPGQAFEDTDGDLAWDGTEPLIPNDSLSDGYDAGDNGLVVPDSVRGVAADTGRPIYRGADVVMRTNVYADRGVVLNATDGELRAGDATFAAGRNGEFSYAPTGYVSLRGENVTLRNASVSAETNVTAVADGGTLSSRETTFAGGRNGEFSYAAVGRVGLTGERAGLNTSAFLASRNVSVNTTASATRATETTFAGGRNGETDYGPVDDIAFDARGAAFDNSSFYVSAKAILNASGGNFDATNTVFAETRSGENNYGPTERIGITADTVELRGGALYGSKNVSVNATAGELDAAGATFAGGQYNRNGFNDATEVALEGVGVDISEGRLNASDSGVVTAGPGGLDATGANVSVSNDRVKLVSGSDAALDDALITGDGRVNVTANDSVSADGAAVRSSGGDIEVNAGGGIGATGATLAGSKYDSGFGGAAEVTLTGDGVGLRGAEVYATNIGANATGGELDAGRVTFAGGRYEGGRNDATEVVLDGAGINLSEGRLNASATGTVDAGPAGLDAARATVGVSDGEAQLVSDAGITLDGATVAGTREINVTANDTANADGAAFRSSNGEALVVAGADITLDNGAISGNSGVNVTGNDSVSADGASFRSSTRDIVLAGGGAVTASDATFAGGQYSQNGFSSATGVTLTGDGAVLSGAEVFARTVGVNATAGELVAADATFAARQYSQNGFSGARTVTLTGDGADLSGTRVFARTIEANSPSGTVDVSGAVLAGGQYSPSGYGSAQTVTLPPEGRLVTDADTRIVT
jgi:hypothetical protein